MTNIATKVKYEMVNFWVKLKMGPIVIFSWILWVFMEYLHETAPHKFQFKWIDSMKDSLNESGFGDMGIKRCCPSAIKELCYSQWITDIFQQNWHPETMSNNQCTIYKMFKETPKQESYLSLLDHYYIYDFMKLRTRTNHLPITKARFHNQTADITCPFFWSGEVGDEIYYLFNCKYFEQKREKSLPPKFLEQDD